MKTNILQTVKDMVFPVFCLGCKEEGVWLCNRCTTQIDASGILLCPMCHESEPYGACCADCRPYSALDSHIACTTYKHGLLVAQLIEGLKYQYVTDLVPVLHSLMQPTLARHKNFLSQADIIVPIPLHAKRFAERGFNQAQYIAEGIADSLELPVKQLLLRTRYTLQQAALERDERIQNLESAFTLMKDVDVFGKDILLVDDVYTTGSTMQAAAKTLRKSGASSVVGLSVARG